MAIYQSNNRFIKSLFPDIIKDRYTHIDNLLFECLSFKKNFVYGKSKFDKILLNPFVSSIGFFAVFFLSFYAIFFLIGPAISAIEEKLLTLILINPIMNFLYMTTDNI
jgi:Fe2+ transport system protein B